MLHNEGRILKVLPWKCNVGFSFVLLSYVCHCWTYNIIIIESIVPSRNIGCLWVLSTSIYRLLRTLVHSSFYPLQWLSIFSIYFSVILSSCLPEGSKVGQPLLFLHPLFLICDQSIQIFFFLFVHLYLLGWTYKISNCCCGNTRIEISLVLLLSYICHCNSVRCS